MIPVLRNKINSIAGAECSLHQLRHSAESAQAAQPQSDVPAARSQQTRR